LRSEKDYDRAEPDQLKAAAILEPIFAASATTGRNIAAHFVSVAAPSQVKHYSKKTDRIYWTSVLPLKRASRTSGDVRFWPIADMSECAAHVRF